MMLRRIAAVVPCRQARYVSLWSKLKEVDLKVNKLGDGRSAASKNTVKWLRIAGLSSTMVLLGAMGWSGWQTGEQPM